MAAPPPKGEYRVVLSAGDVSRSRQLVRVDTVPVKGKSLVARRDIPAWTMIGAYPGTRYTLQRFVKRREQGLTDGKFGVDFWKASGATGALSTKYVIDPGDATGTLLPEFANAVAPLVNEPDPGQAPSLVWVWNVPKYRIEMWSSKPIRAGEELTICYGDGYPRGYATGCTRAGVEPYLHAIAAGRAKPVHWTRELFRSPPRGSPRRSPRRSPRGSPASLRGIASRAATFINGRSSTVTGR